MALAAANEMALHRREMTEAKRALAGVDRILHTGDICGPQVLDALRETAPLTVVRGDNDHGSWAESIPVTETIEIGGVASYVSKSCRERSARDCTYCNPER